MMDKQYYSAHQLNTIAKEHARCAEHLLAIKDSEDDDSLFAVISLMFTAHDLLLNSCFIQAGNSTRQRKTFSELVEANAELALSKEEVQLLKYLGQQASFRKGLDYQLWDDWQQYTVFCHDIVTLFNTLQKRIPIELDDIYR